VVAYRYVSYEEGEVDFEWMEFEYVEFEYVEFEWMT
jgi:hypothetical protein